MFYCRANIGIYCRYMRKCAENDVPGIFSDVMSAGNKDKEDYRVKVHNKKNSYFDSDFIFRSVPYICNAPLFTHVIYRSRRQAEINAARQQKF